MKKIICFHILNNYSGSPQILSSVIKDLSKKGYKLTLFTSKGPGALSNLKDVRYFQLFYRWKSNKIYISILLLITHFQIFTLSFFLYAFKKKKNIIFLINTQSPFSAALIGKLLNIRIIYYSHEYYLKPNIIQKFSGLIKEKFADHIICVSQFLAKKTKNINKTVIYNSVNYDFLKNLNKYKKNKSKKNSFNILQISSLKKYKGVHQFLRLANMMHEYQFTLVVGAPDIEVRQFINKYFIPSNVNIYSQQSNVHKYYQNADLLLNLTLPQLCIETFGMTILEAMHYGIPAIVPPIGGPSELVIDKYNGYLINPSEIYLIKEKIIEIYENKDLYNYLSYNAQKLAGKIKFDNQISSIINIIESLK